MRMLTGLGAIAFAGACGTTPSGPADNEPPAANESAGSVAVSALAHCSSAAALPGWADRAGDAGAVARCGNATVHAAGLRDGLIRLRYAVGVDSIGLDHSWAVDAPPSRADPVRVTGTEDGIEVCTAEAIVTVDASCAVEITDPRGRMLLEDDLGPAVTADGDIGVWRRTPAAERFYGFGEKTGPLDKRGLRMTFWNTDAYDPALGGYRPDQDPLYLSIPWFIGLRDGGAYGVFTDFAGRVDMDMAASDPTRYSITVAAPALDQYVVTGPRFSQVTRRYAVLTGRMPLPPRWALGYHQSRWGYAPASRFDELADRFRSERIPADALWLDIQHMNGFRTFTWDPLAFSDPAGLIDRLEARGFSAIAIADPGIKVDPGWSVYDSGVAGDHFLREPGGSIYEGVAWPGASAFPDFTAAATRTWWSELVAGATATGLRGVWLDVNEPTIFPESAGAVFPGDLPVDGDGRGGTLAEVHNVYALAEARATVDGMRAAAPDRRPFVLSRAGHAGIQRYAAVWTGDVVSNWDGLRGSLPMLLGMGLSGLPLVGSDVGGYSGGASPELYVRWMALGSISPFFRAHVTSGVPGQEPWQFGVEARDISRALIEQRYRLLPYWYSLAHEASVTGAPMLRPMVYEFQDDPATHIIGDQAMLGSFLLAAPVLEPGATTRAVYLPAGRWFEVESGAAYDGPATIDVSVTGAALPMFARAGAIVPRGPIVQHTGEAPLDPLSLDLYPGPAPSTFALYEDAGDGYGDVAVTRYTLASTPTGARLTVGAREGGYAPPPRSVRIRLRRTDGEVSAILLDGEPLEPTSWHLDRDDRAIVAVVPDRTNAVYDFIYDQVVADPRPPVTVTIEVQVPEGTPTDTPIHVATSANGWTHQPLAWTTEAGIARGTIMVPRGEWFFYKFTRGDWGTVEKWFACAEATNRYRFGSATAHQRDTVYLWHDWCQAAPP